MSKNYFEVAQTDLAAILISVYNRFNHFDNCIQSLARCRLADQSDLYIVSDAAKTSADAQNVKFIRTYCETIKGFKNVNLIAREKNMGSHNSVTLAEHDLFQRYRKIIFSEDDNIFSPNFLEFLNEGLNFYENDPHVFSVSGYNYPIKIPKSYNFDVYASVGFAGWGMGIWKDRFEKVDSEIRNFEKVFNNRKKLREFRRYFPLNHDALFRDVFEKRLAAGDVSKCFHVFLNHMYSVFPVVSKVRNMGHDGTGEHCGEDTQIQNQSIDDGNKKSRFIANIQLDANIRKILYRYRESLGQPDWEIYCKHILRAILPNQVFNKGKT